MTKRFSLLFSTAALLLSAIPAQAAVVGLTPNVDLSASGPYTVNFGTASYTFSALTLDPNDTAYRSIGVQTGGSATVFGNGFLSQGQVEGYQQNATFDGSLFFGQFFSTNGVAPIRYSLALDYVALAFTDNGATRYGYAEVGGSSLYRIAFEDTGGAISAGAGITATPGAVPEPATWAMMLTGFGLVGNAMRRRSNIARATA